MAVLLAKDADLAGYLERLALGGYDAAPCSFQGHADQHAVRPEAVREPAGWNTPNPFHELRQRRRVGAKDAR